MASTAGQIGLKISSKKTKHMRMNNRNNAAITVNGEALEEVEYFTYLGSKMTTDGDSEKEVRERISKASQAFASLKTVWRTRKISTKTKLRLFKSNVLSTLLYGAESWKMTKGISHKLEVFQNRCLRRILSIFWPNTISNSELHERTNTKPITLEVRARRWRWIGHVLRMPPASLPRIALRWTPDGRRKRGRPKETWRRTVEREMKEQGWTWNFLERCANKAFWKTVNLAVKLLLCLLFFCIVLGSAVLSKLSLLVMVNFINPLQTKSGFSGKTGHTDDKEKLVTSSYTRTKNRTLDTMGTRTVMSDVIIRITGNRLDLDQHTRQKKRDGKPVRETEYVRLGASDVSEEGPDFYKLEAHILFDDAFEPLEDIQGSSVNRFVRVLKEVVPEATDIEYNAEMHVLPPTLMTTPYGGRLTWTLPCGNSLIVHLKDKILIRNGKRWSQVMYMYYLLAHRLADSRMSATQKLETAQNTFLLALDGDVDFQPEALLLLIDRLKLSPNVGAACGRIHPMGSGYRVEYCAASDSFTYAPEGFFEFFNQRRRWIPSTVANIMDLLQNWKDVTQMNQDISLPYIAYQTALMASTILTAGTIFLLIVGALSEAYPSVTLFSSLLINLIPVTVFVGICFVCKTQTQLLSAAVLTIAYSMLMMMVFVGLARKSAEYGICSVTTIFFFFIVVTFLLAAIFHPQEFSCILHGVLYFLLVPCMSMLLVFYSLVNMHVVSWGTREAAESQGQQHEEGQKGVLHRFLSGITSSSGSGGFRCLCNCCGHVEIRSEDGKRTQRSNSIVTMEKGVQCEGSDVLLPADTAQERSYDSLNQVTRTEEAIETDLNEHETKFWCELIDKYLQPLENDPEEKKRVEAELVALRNKCCVFFFLINGLFVVLIFTLAYVAMEEDSLTIKMPCNSDSFRAEDIQPISMSVMVVFGILLLLQFICMLFHRLSTLLHITADTELSGVCHVNYFDVAGHSPRGLSGPGVR
nr:hypothetical protein BaRGS_009721 [Batillaria attramentaria]